MFTPEIYTELARPRVPLREPRRRVMPDVEDPTRGNPVRIPEHHPIVPDREPKVPYKEPKVPVPV